MRQPCGDAQRNHRRFWKFSRRVSKFWLARTRFSTPDWKNRLTFSAFFGYNASDLSLPLEWKNEKQNGHEQDD